MKSPARRLLEDMTALGFNPFDPQTAFMGLQGLISQVSPVTKGIELQGVTLDAEDGVINAKLIADSKTVWLRFYVMGEDPILGVDYDDDDDVDVEFDLSPLDPNMYGDLIDLGSIDTWMPQEMFQDIVFNDLIPEEDDADKTGITEDSKSLEEMTLSQLQLAALKAFPSSPAQKEIQAEIKKRLDRGEKTWLPPVKKKSVDEEESLDDWEGSGSDGSGTPNEGKLKRRKPRS
jgi:hypothetical protein